MTLLTDGFDWLRGQLETQTATELTALIHVGTFSPFYVDCFGKAVAGAENYDGQDTTLYLTTAIYVRRDAFTEQGITKLPLMAKVDVYDLEGWTINAAESQWGLVFVKLGLAREVLAREWQARRNASAI